MNQNYFDRVYEKTYRPLLKYAIVHLSDPTDAEDALQNVYVDFYRRIERYGHFDILSPEAFFRMLRITPSVQARSMIETANEKGLASASPFPIKNAANYATHDDVVGM